MDINDLNALMGGNLNTEDYSGVWVISLGAKLPAAVLGEARRLADSLGAYVHYIGNADSADAIAFGADRVQSLDLRPHYAFEILTKVFADLKPEFVLLPADEHANALAARLAAMWDGGALLDCIAMRLDENAREVTASHPVFDESYYLDSAITARPQILTLRAAALPAAVRDASRSGDVETPDFADIASAVSPTGEAHYTPPALPLRKALKVVAVGRGGTDEATVELAKQLATLLDAHFAGDRSAFDSGWIGGDQIVGVVGEEISPDIYVALGIWGDTLHRVGVEGAKHIIAVHPDKHAPIFDYADSCIVGEPKVVLPELLRRLGAA